MNRRDFVKAATILSVSSAVSLGIAGLAGVIEKSTGIETYVFQLQIDGGLDNYVIRDSKLYKIEDNTKTLVSNPELKDAIDSVYYNRIRSNRDVFFTSKGYLTPRPKPTDLETRIRYVPMRDFVAK